MATESTRTERYAHAVEELDSARDEAVFVSKRSARRQVAIKIALAVSMHTRMCGAATSILTLAPTSRFAPGDMHWDYGSIAAISRGVLEAALALFHIAVEQVSEHESALRVNVMHLHDCETRRRMFANIDPNDAQVGKFAAQATELRSRLTTNPHYLTLTSSQQKGLLKGERSLMHTQDEVLERMGRDAKDFRLLYELLSQEVHALPMSVYRTETEGRGTGIENPQDIEYTTMALVLVAETLREATASVAAMFPDVQSALATATRPLPSCGRV